MKKAVSKEYCVVWTERMSEWMWHKRVGFHLNCKLEKSNLQSEVPESPRYW